MGVTAVVLAGERPGGDPLAHALGVSAKALIPVAGMPMGERVVRTLARRMPVRVLGSAGCGAALAGVPVEPAAASIAATLLPLVRALDEPLLVTTGDHPLLDDTMLDAFIAEATGSDLAAGLAERRTLLERYPDSRRTWLRFRGGAYSGANLFWIGSRRALPLLERWATVEQRRKRGRALLTAFGPPLAVGILLRRLTLADAVARLGRRYDLTLRAVVLPQAEACIDVDTPDDLALVERVLAAR